MPMSLACWQRVAGEVCKDAPGFVFVSVKLVFLLGFGHKDKAEQEVWGLRVAGCLSVKKWWLGI